MITTTQAAPPIDTTSLSGDHIDLNSFRGRTVLLKFHRFSGCPVARRQIDELLTQQHKLTDAGIETIVVLHSSADKITPNFTETAGVHIVADPDKVLYRAYNCAFDWRKMFSFASWRATFNAFFHGYFPQPTRFQGGLVGIPSDFLIDETGAIADIHYGRHFGDSWTADDVLARLRFRSAS